MVLPVLYVVSVLLGNQVCPGGILVVRTGAQSQLQAYMKTRLIFSQAAPQFLCPEGSRRIPQSRGGGLTWALRRVSWI